MKLRLCLNLEQKFYLMIALVGSFFIVEITTGYICNSLALISDAFHMLSDLIAHGVGLAAFKISKLKSSRNSYGWARAEVMGALVNAVFMLAVCLTIILESIERFLQLQKIERPFLLLFIGIGGLLLNVVGFVLFVSGETKHKKSLGSPRRNSKKSKSDKTVDGNDDNTAVVPLQEIRLVESSAANGDVNNNNSNKKKSPPSSASSINIAAVLRHVIGDAMGSVIVIIVAVLIWLVEAEWVLYLDPTLSLLLVGAMSSSTFPLLNEASQVLMQQSPPQYASPEFRQRLTKIMNDLGVISFHDFHVWRLCGSVFIASIHILIRDPLEYKNVSKSIRQFFHDEKIHSVTIQPEIISITDGASMDQVRKGLHRCSLPCCSSSRRKLMVSHNNNHSSTADGGLELESPRSTTGMTPKLLRKMIHAQSAGCLLVDNDNSLNSTDGHATNL